MKTGTLQSLSALTAVAVFLAGACAEDASSDEDVVRAVSDNTVDFSTFETFTLADPSGGGEVVPGDIPTGNLTVLNNSIVRELEALGLTQVSDGGDLTVGAFVRVDTIEGVATGYWYDYYYGWYWGYYEEWYDAELVEFDVGSIVVDAVDIKDPANGDDDRLVFRGVASGLMYDNAQDAPDRIEDAVHRIFMQWPR